MLFRSAHGLEIVAQAPWAIRAADVNLSQGITLLPSDFDQLVDLILKVNEPAEQALLVVDHYFMNLNRMDYNWLYDSVGLAKLADSTNA